MRIEPNDEVTACEDEEEEEEEEGSGWCGCEKSKQQRTNRSNPINVFSEVETFRIRKSHIMWIHCSDLQTIFKQLQIC